jgi:hypothetical protein
VDRGGGEREEYAQGRVLAHGARIAQALAAGVHCRRHGVDPSDGARGAALWRGSDIHDAQELNAYAPQRAQHVVWVRLGEEAREARALPPLRTHLETDVEAVTEARGGAAQHEADAHARAVEARDCVLGLVVLAHVQLGWHALDGQLLGHDLTRRQLEIHIQDPADRVVRPEVQATREGRAVAQARREIKCEAVRERKGGRGGRGPVDAAGWIKGVRGERGQVHVRHAGRAVEEARRDRSACQRDSGGGGGERVLGRRWRGGWRWVAAQ